MKADNGNQQFWGPLVWLLTMALWAATALCGEEMALRMKRRLSRQMCVLELACGTGLISQRLAGSVKSLEATDYAPGNDCRGKEKVHSVRLHFSVQNATCLPYAPGSFDAVVIANGLHVIPDPKGPVRGPPGAEIRWTFAGANLCPWPGLRLSPAYEAPKASRASDLSQVGCPGVCGFRIPTGLLCYGAGYHGKQNCPHYVTWRRCEGT